MEISMTLTIKATSGKEVERLVNELGGILRESVGQNVHLELAPITSIHELAEQSSESAVTAPAPQEPSAPPATSANVSLEEVRTKLAELVKAGHQAEVKQLLASFGATKLSEVPADRYAELMEKAGAIA